MLTEDRTTSSYLISGGAGFIGSHVANTLYEKGCRVVVIDNLSTGNPENLKEAIPLIVSDIKGQDFYGLIPDERWDAFFHFAAQSSGEASFDDPFLDLRVNVLGTMNCLEFCRQRGISRFLNASSMAVYGIQPNEPVFEQTPPQPISFYGISKLTTEHLCMLYYKQFGIQTTSFRLFNVYGSGQNMKNFKQGMVSIYLAYMLFSEKLVIKGDLSRYRDFIYIDDVVDAFVRAVDAEITFGNTYNIGTGIRTTVKELLSMMLSILNKNDFPIEQTSATPGDLFGMYADISKADNHMGWQPRYSLHEGLKKMILHEKQKLHQ